MLLFAAWFLAGFAVAWWVVPYGATPFAVPLLLAAILLWLRSVNRLPSNATWQSALAVLPALAAFVVMMVPAVLMAPAVSWALLCHQRGVTGQALQFVAFPLVVSVVVGVAAGWLQALAVRWRTGSPSLSSRRIILMTAAFGPAVVMLIGAISLFWPLTD
jgi:hypothetical protein